MHLAVPCGFPKVASPHLGVVQGLGFRAELTLRETSLEEA